MTRHSELRPRSITADKRIAPLLARRLSAPLKWTVHFATRKPLGFVGLAILITVGLSAILAPVIAPYHYATTDFGARLQGPSSTHFLGTDEIGRDLFSRGLYGARVSLGISFAAVVLAKGLATIVALFSGYYGGWADKIGQRFVDVWIALPLLIILITVIGLIGPSAVGLVLIIGLANAPSSSRLIRSVVISVRTEPYVEAARTIGARDSRIILRHVLPNIVYMVIFSATVTLGSVILIVAALGFLGYGVQPPTPGLGRMLSGSGLTFMRTNPWIALWPGIIITIVVFAFNVLGDGVRDILDPRMRGNR